MTEPTSGAGTGDSVSRGATTERGKGKQGRQASERFAAAMAVAKRFLLLRLQKAVLA